MNTQPIRVSPQPTDAVVIVKTQCRILPMLLLVILAAACSTVTRSPELTDIASKPVDSLQLMFTDFDGPFDGFWDITASGEKHRVMNGSQVFSCPPFNQSYRVIVYKNRVDNAIAKDTNAIRVSDAGHFAFESSAVKFRDSFMKYELEGYFPDTSVDINSTGSGTMKWRDSRYGTAGKGCKAQLTISKSRVGTYRVSGKVLLFDKPSWAKANNHHDQRIPGFIVTQEPAHGKLSARELKRGKIVYMPKKKYSGEDFLAYRLWQSGAPFRIYHYYNLLIE